MKRFWILILTLLLVACSSTNIEAELPRKTAVQDIGLTVENVPATNTISPTEMPKIQSTPSPDLYRADYQDFGPAPELENETWLNADRPLRLADLRGQVVLVEMWTFG